MYRELLSTHKFNEEKLIQVSPIFSEYSDSVLKSCYQKMKPNTFFVCEGGGLPAGSTYWLTVVRLEDALFIYNSSIILSLFGENSDPIINNDPDNSSWRNVVMKIGVNNLQLSHYDYLELVIEDFWKEVFNKTLFEMWCGGIIGAHGDKGYGYKSEWEKNGVPFRRGMLIFLLTYTKELGDRPKYESCEWVIESYQKYLPAILKAEQNAGF